MSNDGEDDPFDVKPKVLKRYSVSYGLALYSLDTPEERWPNTNLETLVPKALKGNKHSRPLEENKGWHLYSGTIGSGGTIKCSNPHVANVHCKITHKKRTFYLSNCCDKDSKKGTYLLVQGKTLRPEYPVIVGTRFVVHGCPFEITSLSITAAKEEEKVKKRAKKVGFTENAKQVKYRKINDEDLEWPDEGFRKDQKIPEKIWKKKVKVREASHDRVHPTKWNAAVKVKNVNSGKEVEHVVSEHDRFTFGPLDSCHQRVECSKEYNAVAAYLDCWNGTLYLVAGESPEGAYSPTEIGVFVQASKDSLSLEIAAGDVITLGTDAKPSFFQVGSIALPPGHLKIGGAVTVTRSSLFDRNSPNNTVPMPEVARRIIEPLTHIGSMEGNMADICARDFYMSKFQACVERAKGKRWVFENLDQGKFLFELIGRRDFRGVPLRLKKGTTFCIGKTHFIVSRMRRGKGKGSRQRSKRISMIYVDKEASTEKSGEDSKVEKNSGELIDMSKSKNGRIESATSKKAKSETSTSKRRLSKATVVPLSSGGDETSPKPKTKKSPKKKEKKEKLDAESLEIMNKQYIFSKDKAHAANYRLSFSEHALEVVQKRDEVDLDDMDHFIELQLLRGPARNRCILTDSDWITIGSRPDNEICIADRSISAKHACVQFDSKNREYYLLDRASEHGTFKVLAKSPKKPKAKKDDEKKNSKKKKKDAPKAGESSSEDDDVVHNFDKLGDHRSEVLAGKIYVVARTELLFHAALSESIVQDIKDCCVVS